MLLLKACNQDIFFSAISRYLCVVCSVVMVSVWRQRKKIGGKILTDSLNSNASLNSGLWVRNRFMNAIDRVLQDALGHTDDSTLARICYCASKELAKHSSALLCEQDTSKVTLANCELCVAAMRKAQAESAAKSIDNTEEDACVTSMLRGKCNVASCSMPCFTLYKDIVLNIVDGLAYHRIIRDENGTAIDLEFTEVNPAFERITGIKREVAAGQRITEFLPGIKEDPFDWIGFYAQVAESGEPTTIEQYSHALSRWYQVHLTPKDRNHLTAIFFDVTKLKEAEREVRLLNEQLEERIVEKTQQLMSINNELESFAYSVSHDLRAPLRAIDGFSRALIETNSDKLDERGKHYVDRMRNGVNRMAGLIDDLLKLSRISRRPLNIKEVNLSKVAEEVSTQLRENEPQRKVELILGKDLVAYGDEGLLRIALANLLRNAWKFTKMKETSTIEVSSLFEKGIQIFFVKDNGVGFDMNYADKLFAPFQRLHSAEEFEGSGIGLATVQRVIHRHGGRIWAESQVGQGATFYFTLKVNGAKDVRGKQNNTTG